MKLKLVIIIAIALFCPATHLFAGTLENKLWGFKITIPAEKASEVPKNNPKLVMVAENSEPPANISAFVENIPAGSPATACKSLVMDKIKQVENLRNIETSETPPSYSIFDVDANLNGKTFVLRHAHGFFAYDNRCFDVHISSVLDSSDKGLVFNEFAKKVLASVEVDQGFPLATVEAVALANYTKVNPTEPIIYFTLASEYLHNPKIKNINKALEYYGNIEKYVKNLTRESLWNLYEGLGLSYGEKGEYSKAESYFIKSVETSADQKMKKESLFNLTCSLAHQGKDEESLVKLEETAKLYSKSERQEFAQLVINDPAFLKLKTTEAFKKFKALYLK